MWPPSTPGGREGRDRRAGLRCRVPTYGKVVGWAELPTGGNELHHFGWNACSSALCHGGHAGHLERRYLDRAGSALVAHLRPGHQARSAGARRWSAKSGRTSWPPRPATPGRTRCTAARTASSCPRSGGANGNDGPGGIALLDHDSFDVIGAWELDRGDQFLAYDVWWHLSHDTVITSEWATPSMIENGLNPEDLLGRKFGHHLNFWCMSGRTLTQRIDLGDAHQMVLELRPAHDPAKTWGFAGVVISVEDLSGSVWLWHRDGDRWAARKVITIPAEPADPDDLPPALQPFAAVPPLITDIDLSVDDRWLYVSCWGTGKLKQYDVADPFSPRETGSVTAGRHRGPPAAPAAPGQPLGGGPQMVEISRDGKRVYVTNSLYAAWDDVFYPGGVGAWMAKLDADTSGRRAGARPAVLPAWGGIPRAAGPPDPAAGRGRLQRLLLLHQVTAGAPRISRAADDERARDGSRDQPAAWPHAWAGLPGPVLAGAGLMAAATVAGAWLARRRRGTGRSGSRPPRACCSSSRGCTCSPTHGPPQGPRGSGQAWCR